MGGENVCSSEGRQAAWQMIRGMVGAVVERRGEGWQVGRDGEQMFERGEFRGKGGADQWQVDWNRERMFEGRGPSGGWPEVLSGTV